MKIRLREIKRQWTRNGMRQVIESPHKTFNKQTNLIDNCGNMIASTQNASYIRAYNETECNGHTFEQGYLQQCDTIRLDNRVKRYIYQQDKDHKFWVANFFTRKLFCTLVVDLNTMELKVFNFAKNYKQNLLIDWLIEYLFEKVGE
ncbi:MAG: hypothetical protein IJD48_00370 [Clostridia bacterium]|nr:hypothetical protein [Clostridia bacterium]